MAVLTVLKEGHPTLRKIAKPVTKFDKRLKNLGKDMIDTMSSEVGVGLAAPQVNYSIRLIVIDMPLIDKVHKEAKMFVNPKILAKKGMVKFEEGCLSVPEITEEVDRYEWVKVTYQDIKGVSHNLETDGLLAIVFQHEIDHLDGILFIDRLSPMKKALLKQRISKINAK